MQVCSSRSENNRMDFFQSGSYRPAAIEMDNPRQRFINPFCNDRNLYELQYIRKQILKLYIYIFIKIPFSIK